MPDTVSKVSRLLLLFVFVFVSACSHLQLGSFGGSEEIEKSPNDERLYRSIKLDNALEVLLISDPSTDKAAASMDVYVGSADDPKDFPGLAHFLEHMLFLGTEKYPDPDEYQKYISDHGGRHNAFTSLENTNYFFEVSADSLEGALDRFASQFTSPLFNEDYVTREVNAVHSEYSSKLKDDGRRYFSALKMTLAEDHPYRRFAVGNLETLTDRPNKSLREALLDFYRSEYSANIMKLVILGREPLSELEVWAKSRFSDIPNLQLTHQNINQDFFAPDFLPARLEVETIMDKRSMTLAFPIPSPSAYRSAQPASYLANLLGHEGKGSLLSALKEEGLVDALSAGTQFDTRNQAMLAIKMSLTKKGLTSQDRILELFYSYVKLMHARGLNKMYFDEQARMLEIGFKYQEKVPPFVFVRLLSGAMQEIPVASVLVDGYRLTDYNEALYKRFLNAITPDNMLVAVSAKTIEGKQRSPWFDAPYNITPLDPKALAMLAYEANAAQLSMPEKNLFIPENIELIKTKDDPHPSRQIDQEGMELWHAHDTSFGTPKSNLFVTIRSPEAMKDARSLNKMELMVSLLKDALNEFSYPAYLAGLNYELYNHMRGLTVKISGYSDKQDTMLRQIVESLRAAPFKADRLAIMKERLMRSLENEKDRRPYEQALGLAQQRLLQPSYSPEERLAELNDISVANLEAFRKDFLRALDVAILSNGNILQEDSQAIARYLQTNLLKDAKAMEVSRAKVSNLHSAPALFDSLTVTHPDTGFIYYLQGRDKSYAERARFALLSQLLSSDYYARIRTDKQLGYIVFATHFPMLDVPGIGFIVQSPVATGSELWQETDSFLKGETEILEQLDPTEFERAKAAVISNLSKQDNTLYEKSNRYWQEIDRHNESFDTREQLIAEIKRIALEDLLELYKLLTKDLSGSLLVIAHPEDALDERAPQDFTAFSDSPGSIETFADTHK